MYQEYLNQIMTAETLDDMETIIETAAFDDNLTPKEYSDLSDRMTIIVKSWQPHNRWLCVYCVCNSDGIPFREQEYMTLPDAIARFNREVNEAMELFNLDRKEAEKMFLIKDMETYTTVL